MLTITGIMRAVVGKTAGYAIGNEIARIATGLPEGEFVTPKNKKGVQHPKKRKTRPSKAKQVIETSFTIGRPPDQNLSDCECKCEELNYQFGDLESDFHPYGESFDSE
jgi:hypothetical protein